ncbi:MAG TPA: hypothetical protein VIF84_03615 [Candidatus Limnocylindrales bacterium]
MTSNVAQNYPYGSETEAERAAAVERAVAAFDGLAERIAAEATPLGEPHDGGRWWVWVCPTGEFDGRLHAAGHARERHAVYTICDDCGRSFLR